ncbi:DUF2946 domain-containing protein [Salinicola sp. DM10]|uniref:DUF2946 domain-containing protein n=1 Tax=Salinicola sp. DM10 TaxID=2815721 RepID=UPI001A8E6E20|nr:DUF2946 domain-containing protein [Salinicola sp. DM10]MCE3025549.1 DUF2946 domain-containing protein [Salinicola sp. DM10]
MTRLWHHCYRPLTWLALFAMLMAFVGPLVSQSQRLMEMPAHGGMPLHALQAPTHHAAAPSAAMSGGHGMRAESRFSASDHWHLAACGYCELFLHAPGIATPAVIPPPIVSPAAPSVSAPTPLAAPPDPHARFSPRAPPGAFVLS